MPDFPTSLWDLEGGRREEEEEEEEGGVSIENQLGCGIWDMAYGIGRQ